MKTRVRFRPGEAVRLNRKEAQRISGKREMAYVRQMMSDIDGGVELESPLGRSRCWNVRDLERVPKSQLG